MPDTDTALDRLLEANLILRMDPVTWDVHDLAAVSAAVAELGAVRDQMVLQLRNGEPVTTWPRIAYITGIPISTWRRRHDRAAARSAT